MKALYFVVIISSIWVFFDRRSIKVEKSHLKGFWGMGAFSWFISCLLLWIVAFPMYLIKRGHLKNLAGNTQKASDSNKLENLQKLGELKEKGVISDEEFEKEKAKLIS